MKANIFYVEATYIGSATAAAFHRQQTYTLRIKQGSIRRVYTVPVHGYEAKPIVSMAWTYDTLEEFFKEWKVEQLYNPPYEPQEIGER